MISVVSTSAISSAYTSSPSSPTPTTRLSFASPGGSTEAGLDALAEHDARGAFAGAVTAALERMEGKR